MFRAYIEEVGEDEELHLKTGVAILLFNALLIGSMVSGVVVVPDGDDTTDQVGGQNLTSAPELSTAVTVSTVNTTAETATTIREYNITPGFTDIDIIPVDRSSLTSEIISTNSTEGRVTVEYSHDSSAFDSYLYTLIDETRIGLKPPEESLQVTYQNDSFRFSTHQITHSITEATVSDRVNDKTPLTDVAIFESFTFVSPSAVSPVELDIVNSDASYYYIDATRDESAVSPHYIAEIIAAGESYINGSTVGGDNRSVVVIVGETQSNYGIGGVAYERTENRSFAYIDKYRAHPNSSTVAHEWAHTIQHHEVGTNATWWIEGSAQYLGYYVTDTAPKWDFYGESLLSNHASYMDEHIADPSTWDEPSRINYDYGAHIVYLMDLAIRDGSDGEATIIDYMQTLNQHEGTVTHNDMRAYLIDYGAAEFADEFDEYVLNSTTWISVAREVNEHELLVDVVGHNHTASVDLPPTHEHTPIYTIRPCLLPETDTIVFSRNRHLTHGRVSICQHYNSGMVVSSSHP